MAAPWEEFQPKAEETLEQPKPWETFTKPKEEVKAAAPWEEFAKVEPETPGNRGFVTTDEIGAIAQKYGIDAAELKNIAQLGFGSVVEDMQAAPDAMESIAQGAKEAVGVAGQAIAGEIPVFLYKKMQDNPNMRAAIDELGELSYKQKTKGQIGAELLGNVASGIGATKAIGAAGKLAGLGEKAIAGTQAASGLAGATAMGAASTKEGEEATGAALGFGLGALGELVIPKLLKGAKKADKKVLEEAAQSLEKDAPLIENEVQRVVKEEAAAQPTREALLTTRDGQAALDSVESFSRTVNPEAEKLLAKKPLDKIADMSDEAKRFIADDMERQGLKFEDEPSLQKYMALRGAQQEAVDFARFLTPEVHPSNYKDALSLINKKIAVEGEDFILRESRRFRQAEAAEKVIAEAADRAAPSTYAKSFMTFIKDGISDFYTYVAPSIDRRLGTNMQGLLDNASAARNKLSMLLNSKYQIGLQLEKQAKKAGVDNESTKSLMYNALDTGNLSSLTPEQQAIAKEYQKWFEKGRQDANAFGLPITQVKGGAYVPHSILDIPDAIVALETKAKSLGIARGVTQEEFNALTKNPEFKELLKGVEIMSGGKTPTNAKQFNTYLVEATQAGLPEQRASTIASAALAREGEMPDFLRQKDITKLFMQWHHNTFRHALMRDTLSEARRIRNLALDAGDTRTSTYLTNWLADITGSARATSPKAAAQLYKNQAQLYLTRLAQDSSKSGVTKELAKFVLDTPSFLGTLFRQIYPNLLGTSIKALVPNIVQPLAVGIPELGSIYGTMKLSKAYMDVINTLRNGKEIKVSLALARDMGLKEGSTLKTNELSTILKNMGQMPSTVSKDALNALRSGIGQSAPYKMAESVLDKTGQIAMALYEKSELLNRAVIWSAAQDIAGDVLAGSGKAMDALGGMSPGLKKTLAEAAKNGSEEDVKRIVTQYLQSKVSFNYNKETMSAYGRFMGPLFSVFTKWPTAIAGDIFNILESQGKRSGYTELARKYLAPLMGLYALDKLVLPGQDESDVQKVTLGSGLTRLATAGNVASIAKGDIFQPPAIQLPKNTVAMVQKIMDNPERAMDIIAKTTGEQARTFMPGAGYLNFLSQDLPTLMGQPLEREGNFFEKTVAGLGRLEREVSGGFNKISEFLKQQGKGE